jgi:hypothetical protein
MGLTATEVAPAASPGPTAAARARRLLGAAACAALAAASAAAFLPHQSLWNDEATQLSGLTLGPVEVVPWLAGRTQHDFGVPDDRMPPGSYWAGWAWSRAFGLSEPALRRLGVACTAAAAALVFEAARSAWGMPGGLAAGALFALSPNVAVQAVEIRAYPMFLLAAAGAVLCLARIAADPAGYRRGWLVGLAGCGVAAMYLHFFGLVLCGATLLAALLVVAARGGRIGPVLVAGACCAVAALGLVPFVQGALAKGAGGRRDAPAAPADEGSGAAALAPMVYRQVVHPAMAVRPAMVAAAGLGALLAGGAVARMGWRRRPPAPASVAAALAAALAAGLLVTAAAALLLRGFDAARPSYSIWAIPGLMVLLAGGLAAPGRPARAVAAAGILTLLAAEAFGIAQLATRGDWFAHTPHRPIAALIRAAGPARTTIVYDGPISRAAWHIYAPIRYEFGAIPQYVLDDAGAGAPVRVRDYPDRLRDADPTALPAEVLVVVRAERVGTAELTRQIGRGALRPLGDGPVSRALAASGRWERAARGCYPGFVVADVSVFRRRDVPAPGPSGGGPPR